MNTLNTFEWPAIVSILSLSKLSYEAFASAAIFHKPSLL
jgi:hypothetical protein